MFLRVYLDEDKNLFASDTCEILFGGLWAFCGCYPLGQVLKGEEKNRFLIAVISIWTVAMAVYSILGIYAAWNSISIPNLSGKAWWGFVGKMAQRRLNLVYSATISGATLETSIILAFICQITSRKRIAKLLFAVAVCPMILALCLTGCRSAQVGLGTAAGTMVFAWTLSRYKKKGIRKAAAWAVSITAGIAVIVGTVLLLQLVNPVYNSARNKGIIIKNAEAESGAVETSSEFAAERGFLVENPTTGRDKIWRGTFEYIENNPILLLTGTSVNGSMSGISALIQSKRGVAHCHNILLQVLLESGIPGLLLYLGYMGILGKRHFRLLLNDSKPWLFRLMPAFIAGICIEEMVDCFTWFYTASMPTVFFFYTVLGFATADFSDSENAAGLRRSDERGL